MAKSDIRYVPAFRAGEEYERQSAEARRRQALAEALEAQAYRPLSGSAAPIPSAAPLVMALQSFMSARQRRKAEEAAEKAGEFETQVGKQIAGRLRGGYVYDEKAPPPAEIPEQTTLEEVRPTAQYRRDVEGAMDMAMSPVGTAAMKRAPMLAAALERSMTPAEAEEYYAPVVDESGKYIQFGKRGGTRTSTVAAKREEAKGTALSQLIAERSKLQPGDPNIAYYDAAIAKETTRPSGPVTNVYGSSAIAGVDEQGNPIFAQLSRTGGPASIVEGVRPAPKGMNESQSKAAGFADRITEANPVFEMGPVGIEANVLSDIPFGAGNFAMTPQQQLFLQAERNFINAILRRESGATIMPDEFKNARQQYIPQPGDSRAVLEQKRRNRNTVLNSLQRDAGPQYKPPVSITGSGFSEGGWGEAQVVR